MNNLKVHDFTPNKDGQSVVKAVKWDVIRNAESFKVDEINYIVVIACNGKETTYVNDILAE